MRLKDNKITRTTAPSARPHAPTSPAFALNTLAAAVAGILCCAGGAYAADETAAASDESNALNEIVVTASAQGVKKLDASYNIVSASLEEIQNAKDGVLLEQHNIGCSATSHRRGERIGPNQR